MSMDQDEVENSTLDATNAAAASAVVDEMMVEDNGGGSGALDFSSLVPLCVARKAFDSRQVPFWDSLSVVGVFLRIGKPGHASKSCIMFRSTLFCFLGGE